MLQATALPVEISVLNDTFANAQKAFNEVYEKEAVGAVEVKEKCLFQAQVS